MENHKSEHGLSSYLIGFVLAVVLTAIPFYVVITTRCRPSAR